MIAAAASLPPSSSVEYGPLVAHLVEVAPQGLPLLAELVEFVGVALVHPGRVSHFDRVPHLRAEEFVDPVPHLPEDKAGLGPGFLYVGFV